MGTLVEPTTPFTVLSKMEDTSAESAVEGFSRVLNRVEAQKRLSLTYDQGREMSEHRPLTEATGLKVYFADPPSPWQRGINENTNGLLRQYPPKEGGLESIQPSAARRHRLAVEHETTQVDGLSLPRRPLYPRRLRLQAASCLTVCTWFLKPPMHCEKKLVSSRLNLIAPVEEALKWRSLK